MMSQKKLNKKTVHTYLLGVATTNISSKWCVDYGSFCAWKKLCVFIANPKTGKVLWNADPEMVLESKGIGRGAQPPRHINCKPKN